MSRDFEDPDAEMLLLAARVHDPVEWTRIVARVGGVVQGDFGNPPHRRIASAMDAIEARGAVPDRSLLRTELEAARLVDGDIDRVLADVVLASETVLMANATEYAKRVRELASRRACRSLIAAVQEALDRADADPLTVARTEVANVDAMFSTGTSSSASGANVASLDHWRTLGQIEADIAARPTKVMLWPGFLAAREVAALAGSPKAGKSDVVAAFIASATLGTEWLGVQLEATHVILVSEEGDDDLVKKARFFGATPDRLHVLSRDAVGGITPPWAVLVAAAVRRAVGVGATILVVDTFAAWAGLVDDDERSEGVVGPLLKALQPARDAGLATLVVHHLVKAADVRGVAALRGSGAFAASVESIGLYRAVGTDPQSARRSLEVFSRPHGLATFTLERVTPETQGVPAYYRIPSDDPSTGQRVEGFNRHERTIVGHLSRCATWNTLAKVQEATGLSKRLLEGALPAMFAQGKVQRRGDGRRGMPFEYAAPGIKCDVSDLASRRSADSPQTHRAPANQREAAREDGGPAVSPQAPHTPYGGGRAAENRGPVRTVDDGTEGTAVSPHGGSCGDPDAVPS